MMFTKYRIIVVINNNKETICWELEKKSIFRDWVKVSETCSEADAKWWSLTLKADKLIRYTKAEGRRPKAE